VFVSVWVRVAGVGHTSSCSGIYIREPSRQYLHACTYGVMTNTTHTTHCVCEHLFSCVYVCVCVCVCVCDYILHVLSW
jgi:hypothetical protein